MIELLFLLLPFAAYSGWLIGIREKKKANQPDSKLYRGMGHLLKEEPDEALNTFASLIRTDTESIEIDMALGALFRRRGEVQRAIKIHQNIVARPSLKHSEKKRAMFELGLDYMSAGLLDRSEGIFLELITDPNLQLSSLRQLILIYENTQEWEKAIELAESTNIRGEDRKENVIAHFYCELAQEQITEGDTKRANYYLKRAAAFDKQAIRVLVMLAQAAKLAGQFKQAIKNYRQIITEHPAYLGFLLPDITECFEQLNDKKGYHALLKEAIDGGAGISAILAYAEHLKQQENGDKLAVDYLYKYVESHPSLKGVAAVLDAQIPLVDTSCQQHLERVKHYVAKMLDAKPQFICQSCRFTSKVLYWRCPRCKQWDSISPIMGLEGE